MATVDEMVGPAVVLAGRAASLVTGVDLVAPRGGDVQLPPPHQGLIDGGLRCW